MIQRRTEQSENEQISVEKMTFCKLVGPNGTVITMSSGKAGSRQGVVWWAWGGVFWRLLGRKPGSKGAFTNILKIENGTKNLLFITVRHWGLFKTVPGSGFEKT